MYNAFKSPTTWDEYGGFYLGMDNKVHKVGEISTDKRTNAYTDMSIWDVHRTQFPLLSFMKSDIFEDIIASL